MMDAYCHLDMERESPLADFEQRMGAAEVAHALLVETWDGRNRPLLESVLQRREEGRFQVGLCYRKARSAELRGLVQAGGLPAVRMSTANLDRDTDFCRDLGHGGTILIAHAEDGVGGLCRALARIRGGIAGWRIYIPHLGWPVRNGKADADWEAALTDFTALPNVTLGVSAIAHFSNQPFPHPDVRDFALRAISRLPASRIAIGSDYPLIETTRYTEYMALAREWVTSIYPDWSFAF